ncbi:DUF4113 domain-containing protein [Burkholderia ubonensis]|uniref:DUF4113 domain-containing protein n=1 Tax=Burkholderia ubonensis TaxID=101571 RepID=UPI0022B763C6|nr:DUF4113 domain-containing protein [Burkholderia ubonensis]
MTPPPSPRTRRSVHRRSVFAHAGGNVEGHQAWYMSQNAKKPAYTTEWEGLPTAR